jgi:hypothetical protein
MWTIVQSSLDTQNSPERDHHKAGIGPSCSWNWDSKQYVHYWNRTTGGTRNNVQSELDRCTQSSKWTTVPYNQNWTNVLEHRASQSDLYHFQVLLTTAELKEVRTGTVPYCSRNNTYHAAEVEPLYGTVLIITANHLAVGNLRDTKIVTFPQANKKRNLFEG